MFLGVRAVAGVPLHETMGRNETRIWSARWSPQSGLSFRDQAIEERLERLGYERVSGQPTRPHQWGREGDIVWIYRPAHRSGGQWRSAKRFGLALHPQTGEVLHGVRDNQEPFSLKGSSMAWLEPELLGESFGQNRARRIRVSLDTLPAHVAQPFIALEDQRFYRHFGVDPKGLLRAAVANVKAGKTVQGGSTITQQLIKTEIFLPDNP